MLNLTKGLLFAFCALFVASLHADQSDVRINEIQASNTTFINKDGSITDWIELVNTSSSTVDLSYASLTDDPTDQTKWPFPFGTSIPGNGYLLIAFDPNRPPSTSPEPNLNAGFSLKAAGGTLQLYSQDFALIDSVDFGNQIADLTIGRVNGTWKLCSPTPRGPNASTNVGSAVGLKINEWMANPPAGDNDWFEIYNPGTVPVALDGLYLTDTLATKTMFKIAPLSFIGVGFQAYAVYIADGSTNKGPEHVNFSLKAGGEAIGLYDGLGTRMDSVTFGSQTQGVSEGRLLDGSSTITTFPGTPSPGRVNYKKFASVIVNEVLAHTDPPLEDAVEFYNTSAAPVDISGWFLSNKEADLKKYKIPAGTIIPAKGYKVIYEGAFNNTNTAASPFTFNSAHGDQVYLAEADANGNLTGFRVSEEFEASENSVSMGRVETTVPGDYKFVELSARTFGMDNPTSVEEFRTGAGVTNALPKIGPVIFNEVHYNPLSLDGTDNRDDEFIELYNITSSPAPLYDPEHPENHWRLQNGVSFVFPGGRSIPAFGYVLVVSFDPTANPAAAAGFRSRLNVPSTVPIFGPFAGDLNNSGDSLELYKPDPPQIPPHPDAGFVPYIRVDKVNYSDAAPWPSTPDGAGFSLQRKDPFAFGNDPINWSGATPTPGKPNSADLADTDHDGMLDKWEDDHGLDKNNAADAALDPDNDSMTNLQEFYANTDPHSATSKLQVTGVVAPTDADPNLKIKFIAAPNVSYQVQYRSSLDISSDWQKLANVPSESFSHEVIVEDPDAVLKTDRYYRVITQ
jgi:hypothetical protein